MRSTNLTMALLFGAGWLLTSSLRSEPPRFAGETVLRHLEDFAPTAANWRAGRLVTGDPRTEKNLSVSAGEGLLANIPDAGARGNLASLWEHGDMEFECEFLLPKGSNSGIYFMSRYEVQLYDSWKVSEPKFSDCGGIYERWDDGRGTGNEGYEGIPPRANACRAPGLWQTLKVQFRAPRFDQEGRKVENARFIRVVLNGFLVQEDVAVTGPTRGASAQTELAFGPLKIQGSHGPVAFRNIRCRELPPPQPETKLELNRRKAKGAHVISAKSRTRLQRCFVPYLPSKRLYACSVGTPEGVNYSYDFETGALLSVWRGGFLDMFEMWEGRGLTQLAQPMGAVLNLNASPSIAYIENPFSDGWPQAPSILYQSKGYKLDRDGTPVFLSSLGDLLIGDRFSVAPGGEGLSRTVTVEGAVPRWTTFLLLAEAGEINAASTPGSYIVGDRQCYLDWPQTAQARPVIRTVGGRQQLVVRLPENTANEKFEYTIIW